MTDQTRRRPAVAGPGAWDERIGLGTRGHDTAWQRWAHHLANDRLTAHQTAAVELLRAGAAESPEAALILLDAGKGAA